MIVRFLTTLWVIAALHAFAQPTDNPYKTFYNITGYHWTDSLAWDKVLNIQQFTGATMVERFNKARDSAFAMGGAVIYFPAGVYQFEDNINLKSGVIIRGANPLYNNAKSPDFAPPTIFEFPAYVPTLSGSGTPNNTAFKGIGALPHTSRAAIVNVDVNNARVSLASSTFITVNTPRGSTSRSVENNRNLLIMGVRSNNVAVPYNTVPAAGQHAWQRFSSPFVSNIRIYAAANAAIVNCRINDFENNNLRPVPDLSYDQPGYLAQKPDNTFDTVVEPWHAKFDYTAHHGISVNRKATITNAMPDEEPGSFAPGLEIRDNWIYHTMRVGIICSGMGIVVKGNVIRDKPNKAVYLHPHGVRFATNNAATYENRGIDFGGWDVVIEDNDVEVYRHRINDGPYSSVDGEGILTQECCGGTAINGVSIRRNLVNAYIGLWKMRDIMNVVIDSNNLQNNPIIMTANRGGANNIFTFHRLYNNKITNNINVSSINCDGNLGGTNVLISHNQGTSNATITAPCYATVVDNSNFSQIRYSAISTAPSGPLVINNQLCPQIADNFPKIWWANPANDTTIYEGSQGIELMANFSNVSFDSLIFYRGTEKIATLQNNNSAYYHSWPWERIIPFIPYAYRVLGVADSARLQVWSPNVYITFIKTSVTDNEHLLNTAPIRIYPNPASQILHIGRSLNAGDLTKIDKILIVNTQGKIFEASLNGTDIPIGHLSKGLYYLHIISGSAAYKSKFIKL